MPRKDPEDESLQVQRTRYSYAMLPGILGVVFGILGLIAFGGLGDLACGKGCLDTRMGGEAGVQPRHAWPRLLFCGRSLFSQSAHRLLGDLWGNSDRLPGSLETNMTPT